MQFGEAEALEGTLDADEEKDAVTGGESLRVGWVVHGVLHVTRSSKQLCERQRVERETERSETQMRTSSKPRPAQTES